MESELLDLKGLTVPQLQGLLTELGIPATRASHIFHRLYLVGCSTISGLGLKASYQTSLAARSIISTLAVERHEISQDGTEKFAFALDDGSLIESVLIPQDERHTLCVSSQVGCAMGCTFCLTATMGFVRNLSPAEIVGQVVAVIDALVERGMHRATRREYINNLVFMGMGEPLANYANVTTALAILMAEEGLEFTERLVTISTCGLAPRIRDLGHDTKVNLAISLHAANDQTRDRLMPVNRRYPLAELLAACRAYPLTKRRVILMEYILLAGINDSEEDARQLAALLADIPCRVNLLPYNECEELEFRQPAQTTIQNFKRVLYEGGVRAFVRDSRGADISAACGQLAVQQG